MVLGEKIAFTQKIADLREKDAYTHTHSHTHTMWCRLQQDKKKGGEAFRIVGWVYVHVNFLQLFLG